MNLCWTCVIIKVISGKIMVNAFDDAILRFLNQFAFRSDAFDHGVIGLTGLYATRGLPLIAMLWWVWFRNGERVRSDREIVIVTLAAGFVSLFLGRLLALSLPFRLRPLVNPALNLQFPMDPAAVDNAWTQTWSSFPSDHAMLWFAVASGVFLASKRVGIVALIYAATIICLPRVYAGLHYPSDVLGGALLGAMVCVALNLPRPRKLIANAPLNWSVRYQGVFHVAIFLLSFQVVTQFDEVRRISAWLGRIF